MNYLAHLFLAEPSDETRIGSILADFTVGTISQLEEKYGERIARGIRHHREVDRYTDSHPAVLESIDGLRDDYGLYGGIIVDVVFDHFLINHWETYTTVPLEHFFDSIYGSLDRSDWDFPPRYSQVIRRLVSRRWLGSYRDIDMVGYALRRIGERFSHKTPLDNALMGIKRQYKLLEDSFISFFPDLVAFSNKVLRTF